ncbi:hypothetical protein ABZ917_17855 [Nonomuraea wenchangensis]
MTRLFSRRRGRHCRHGSLTGWSALASVAVLVPVVEDDTCPRSAPVVLVPLAPFPTAADDLAPLADYQHPYSPKDAA